MRIGSFVDLWIGEGWDLICALDIVSALLAAAMDLSDGGTGNGYFCHKLCANIEIEDIKYNDAISVNTNAIWAASWQTCFRQFAIPLVHIHGLEVYPYQAESSITGMFIFDQSSLRMNLNQWNCNWQKFELIFHLGQFVNWNYGYCRYSILLWLANVTVSGE